jgi:hypothetical protein
MGSQPKIIVPTVLSSDYEAYKARIENLAANKDGMIFFNSGKEHAAIVMSNIFKYSKSSLKILAGDFNGAVCGNADYITQLKSFLNRKGKLEILMDDYNSEKINNPFAEVIKFYSFFNKDLVSVKKTNGKLIDSETQKPIHLTIGDNDKFRYEYDTNQYSAKCSFNNQTIASTLAGHFDTLFLKGEPVNL